jgi:hypothetical protein
MQARMVACLLTVGDWAAIGTAVGTFLLAIVAVFQDRIRTWIRSPKISVSASDQSPHCVLNSYLGDVQRPHYSLRIAVENLGRAEGRQVEVLVKNLQRQRGHGNYETVTTFRGTYLVWSGSEGKRVLEVLNPEMPKYCYLGRIFWRNGLPTSWCSGIADPTEDYLGTATLVDFPAPLGSRQRQRFGPGNYLLTIRIGAANAKPIEKTLKINITGRWTQNVAEVLELGIRT